MLTLLLATVPTTTTTMEPTTPSPEALRYPASTDYHWDQFNKNVTAAGIEGNWKPGWGTSNGPLGFGKAIYLEDYQVREKLSGLKSRCSCSVHV